MEQGLHLPTGGIFPLFFPPVDETSLARNVKGTIFKRLQGVFRSSLCTLVITVILYSHVSVSSESVQFLHQPAGGDRIRLSNLCVCVCVISEISSLPAV